MPRAAGIRPFSSVLRRGRYDVMTATSKYWCTESLLVTVSGPEGRFTVDVDKPYARIGSHHRSEVRLAADGTEARCFLHATAEGIFCVHLSLASTIPPGYGSWLKPEEVLQIGTYAISARSCGEADVLRHPRCVDRLGQQPAGLRDFLTRNRDKRGFRAHLNLVGRRRELALQMQGQQVSSCHCAPYWESGRLWCIDLLSSNGTQLHDVSIDCSLLEVGRSPNRGVFPALQAAVTCDRQAVGVGEQKSPMMMCWQTKGPI